MRDVDGTYSMDVICFGFQLKLVTYTLCEVTVS